MPVMNNNDDDGDNKSLKLMLARCYSGKQSRACCSYVFVYDSMMIEYSVAAQTVKLSCCSALVSAAKYSVCDITCV